MAENTSQKVLRKLFKGTKFRIAGGSDNPYSTAIPRVIITPKDKKDYLKLKLMEEKLLNTFDVEDVVFKNYY